MYKYVSNNKVVWSYMDFLVIENGELTLYWENNTSYISVFAAKRVTPRVKNIDIPVCFLQKQYGNGIFIPVYEKYVIVVSSMSKKLCLGPIISHITK